MGNALRGSNKQGSHAITLLQRAMDGDIREVKHMVDQHRKQSESSVGADSAASLAAYVDTADPQGNNALIGAVFSGKMDVVEYLVEECGASVTCKNSIGCSPLWLAAAYSRPDVLEYLLQILAKRKALPSELMTTNNSGDSALLAASSKGNLECCKILLESAHTHGVRTELLSMRNRAGDLPLSVALSNGHDGDIIDLLLIGSSKEELNKPNEKGIVPLLVACERDDVKSYKRLMASGASLETRDAIGSSPLTIAAFCGSTSIMKELLANKKELLEVANINGCTPLWLAARSGRHETVQMLVDAGANRDTKNDGLTPLDVARKFNKTKVVEVLEASN